MRSLTLKYLLTAIALPLFASTLSIATPVGAEQIGRSRSITAMESSGEDPIPSVTDLNLSVPVVGVASVLTRSRPERRSVGGFPAHTTATRQRVAPLENRQNLSSETPIRSNSSHKHSAKSPTGKHSHRSISTQNLSTTTQAPRVKSSTERLK